MGKSDVVTTDAKLVLKVFFPLSEDSQAVQVFTATRKLYRSKKTSTSSQYFCLVVIFIYLYC